MALTSSGGPRASRPRLTWWRPLSALTLFSTALLGSAASATQFDSTLDIDWEWRMHASACKTLGGSPVDMNYGIANYSTTQAMIVLCPVQGTTQHRLGGSISLALYGYGDVGHSEKDIDAMVCQSYYSRTGGECSAPTGLRWLSVHYTDPQAIGVLNFNDDRFTYAWFSVPERQGSSTSGLRGIHARKYK